MSGTKTAEPIATATVTLPNTWNVVRTEQPDRIVCETVGDCVIGRLVAKDTITPPPVPDTKTGELIEQEPFIQLVWRDALVGNVGEIRNPDYSQLESMDYVCINAGYALTEAFKEIELETFTRLTLIKEIKVKGQPTPMKDYRVETAA